MNIGFIADDSKKKLMQNFCIAYRGILNDQAVHSSLHLRLKIIAWIWYFTSVIQTK